MEFKDKLLFYMEQYNITVHELADKSGLSDALISRYKNGERVPKNESENLKKLSFALSTLIQAKTDIGPGHRLHNKKADFSTEAVYESLSMLLLNHGIDPVDFANKLSLLFNILEFSISGFSKYANYDASFISRILNGKRQPADYSAFAGQIASYTGFICRNEAKLNRLLELLDVESGLKLNEDDVREMVLEYLLQPASFSEGSPDSRQAREFLDRIDTFDLEEYIRKIHFDKLKVPSFPFKMPVSRNYLGAEGMKKAEIDFLKNIAFSDNQNPVFLYSTMPMTPLMNDSVFVKKWMLGLAAVIKKGHDLHMIHDLNRPFKEMMAGVNGWIPLYMTGQVHPYYIDDSWSSDIFMHLIRFSDDVALAGDCSDKDLRSAFFHISGKKTELDVYRAKKDAFFEKAKPLMTIYKENDKQSFYSFLEQESISLNKGICNRFMSAPPIYTLDFELINSLLANAHIPADSHERIFNEITKYARFQKELISRFTSGGTINEYIPVYSHREIEKYPPCLAISGIYPDINIPYTDELYEAHLKLTKENIKPSKNHMIHFVNDFPFRNIQIMLANRDWVIVSKNNSPSIQFVIKHPKLIAAINSFTDSIVQKK